MSPARFGLSRGLVSDRTLIELSEDEYSGLIDAKRKLVALLDAEETFDVLIENFIELEKTCLGIAAEQMVCGATSYSTMHGYRRHVARRLSNLLSASRTYLDVVEHVDASLRLASDLKTRVTESRHQEYETRLGYRVMEALRNHAQHRGLPVDSITVGGKRDGEFWAHGLRLTISASLIREREHKPKVHRALDEASLSGDKLDLVPLLRQYVSGIAAIHDRLRKWHANDIRESEKAILNALDRMAKACGKQRVVACDAFELRADNHIAAKTDIFHDLVDYRRELATKNSAMMNLEWRYVTGS